MPDNLGRFPEPQYASGIPEPPNGKNSGFGDFFELHFLATTQPIDKFCI